MARGDDDETIINSTQTELSMFLVIAFVVLLGFMLTDQGKIGGPGEAHQGQPKPGLEKPKDPMEPEPAVPPEVPPGSVSVLPPPPPSPPAIDSPRTEPTFGESAEKARMTVKSCNVKFSEERRALILDMEQVDTSGAKRLLFAPGQFRISDDVWNNCIDELFQAVLSTYKQHRDTTRHVVIQGHASSEWPTAKGCDGVPGTLDTARQAHVAYKCNRTLSQKRADEIFELGYFAVSQWGEVNADAAIPREEFAQIFVAEGRSSLDLVRDAEGAELQSQSRRVEFVFVRKD